MFFCLFTRITNVSIFSVSRPLNKIRKSTKTKITKTILELAIGTSKKL